MKINNRSKANRILFEEFRVEIYDMARSANVGLLFKIQINIDNLSDRMLSLENYCDKYIPLMAQNIT